ncbi:membrane-bound O-acyltransferase Gup1p [Trichomonascus vanleenenianus]|uniref:O-acyltransferase n=1 Tax=Trichomonascus vanleenenianus TaxID=2268995 RepID=UPI003ECB27FF
MSKLVSLLSVEVLDTRLGPAEDEKKRQAIINSAGKPRWKTKEFYFYGVIFALAVPMMFKAAIDASSQDNANYDKYKHLLSDGWMFGRKVDNSDDQYSGVRNNLPYLACAILGEVILKRVYFMLGGKDRRNIDLAFSVIFLIVLYGINVSKILTLISVNYAISSLPRKSGIALTWIFGVGILFANELCLGYPFRYIPQLAFLDKYSGIFSRWDVNFNFTMLRMVSFNVDYFKARDNGLTTTEKEKAANSSPATMSERERIETFLPLEEYNFKNYLVYALYGPLYIAGPILTFNDFTRQIQAPLPSINTRRITLYAVRFLFCLLTMEFLLHFTYVVAISKTRAWDGDSPFQISMIALFNLNVIWLKLLIPWRLFRLWALLDGIDPPENMVRCVNNNYSALSFWRSWHRSYNRWTLRYIYIPLGGTNRPILNSLIVFSFVAIWHDIQLHLLFWGWLVVLFILPEVAATMAFPAKKWAARKIYRHLCAIGAVANIWMMMIANLIGFCVQLDGMKQMLDDMFNTAEGLKYVIVSTACLFVGAQAMFEFREREKRKGINLRC